MFRILPLIPVQAPGAVAAVRADGPDRLHQPAALADHRGFWTDAPWGGLSNFVDALTDEGFFDAVGRTFYFAGVAVVLELRPRLRAGHADLPSFRGRRFYTTIFLVPMMIVPIVVGYNFSMIYIDSGPLNQIWRRPERASASTPRIRWLSHPIAAQWGRSSSPTSGSGPR